MPATANAPERDKNLKMEARPSAMGCDPVLTLHLNVSVDVGDFLRTSLCDRVYVQIFIE